MLQLGSKLLKVGHGMLSNVAIWEKTHSSTENEFV